MVNIRAACLAAAVLALSVNAAPTPNAYPASLSRRQDAQTPRTIQTQDVTKVSGGTIVRDCTVVFEDLDPNSVRKTERCTEMFVPNGQPLPPAPTAQPPVASPDPAPPTSAPLPTDTTTAPADTTTPPADPAPTTAPTEGGNDPQQPVDTNSPPAGEPTENPDAPGNDQPTQPAGNEQGSTGGDGAPTDSPAGGVVTSSDGAAGPSPTDPPQGGSTVTGTRAGAEASPTSGQVNVPGKSVEVLPIGLGVFAGISVIALIVVGLTTYERTKYRKAFRARRLAAGGAEMGYGGMSERR